MLLRDFYPNVPTAAQSDLIVRFTESYRNLAAEIVSEVPPSSHRTTALRKLLESKMTLIHGITHPVE